MDEDPEREHRIHNDIIVDAYGAEEHTLSSHYLEDTLAFPFPAHCIAQRHVSPLKTGGVVTVIGMADEEDCEHEMIVIVDLLGRDFGVPLSQLEPVVTIDDDTRQSVADWHYWGARGYEL